ncbi:6296_t:CDS:2, partial [Paraglomus brasilianum]
NYIQDLEKTYDKLIQKLKEKDNLIQQLKEENKEHLQALDEHDHIVAKFTDLLGQEKKEFHFRERRARVNKFEKICNVKAGLEYVWALIIRFDLSKSFELVDAVFLSLFEECPEELQKTCEKNKLNVESVKACVAGLYDKSCKRRHVGEYYVAIWAKYWNPNE